MTIVLLPRNKDQRARYAERRVTIPEKPIDGTALLAAADLVVGGGGTMTREAALLGTPTYTVFMSKLAAVDSELIRLGLITDLRERGRFPTVEKKSVPVHHLANHRGTLISDTVAATVRDLVDTERVRRSHPSSIIHRRRN